MNTYTMTWITRTGTTKTTERFARLASDDLKALSRTLSGGEAVSAETYKLLPLKD